MADTISGGDLANALKKLTATSGDPRLVALKALGLLPELAAKVEATIAEFSADRLPQVTHTGGVKHTVED